MQMTMAWLNSGINMLTLVIPVILLILFTLCCALIGIERTLRGTVQLIEAAICFMALFWVVGSLVK